ncbi:MAG: hypothetical protein HQL95_07685 [Magnetococcales bacterium]|nr:hypothetical protein [Magnetococcales bacterium]
MEHPFLTVFVALMGLILLFWFLLRLRTLREASIQDEKPADKLTVLLGLFYVLSRACLNYYRDRNTYPPVVSGAPEGLMELGYLKDEPLAEMTSSLKLFSIVATDKAGCGICLAHIKASVAMEFLRRVAESKTSIEFQDYRGGQYKPLTSAGDTLVNLTLPLPVRPVGAQPPKMVLEGAAAGAPVVVPSGDDDE